jgi:phosphatidylinositol glycan class N
VANTETPLIVWGAGVRGPIPERKSIRRYSSDSVATPPAWGLNHLLRVDVEQADIAPLMSSLIGVPIPANNVGMLPARMLDTEEHVEFVLRSMHANAEQIFRQLEMKSGSHVRFSKNESFAFF